MDLDSNLLNVPPGYPDLSDPLQVLLSHKDPDWQLYQGFERLIGSGGGEITSSDGRMVMVIPPGALDGDTAITFIPKPEPTYDAGWMAFAKNSFKVTAEDAIGNPVITFNLPVTVTLTYTDTDIVGPEDTLGLYYWDITASAWADAVATCPGGEYIRNMEENMLSLPLCHLTEFGLFSTPLRVFMTMVGSELSINIQGDNIQLQILLISIIIKLSSICR